MKVYASFVKHYEFEVEVPDDATTADIYDAVSNEIDLIYNTDTMEMCEDDEYIVSIVDKNDNIVWES